MTFAPDKQPIAPKTDQQLAQELLRIFEGGDVWAILNERGDDGNLVYTNKAELNVALAVHQDKLNKLILRFDQPGGISDVETQSMIKNEFDKTIKFITKLG